MVQGLAQASAYSAPRGLRISAHLKKVVAEARHAPPKNIISFDGAQNKFAVGTVREQGGCLYLTCKVKHARIFLLFFFNPSCFSNKMPRSCLPIKTALERSSMPKQQQAVLHFIEEFEPV